METINTLLLIFLELTFIFVVLLLLFSQKKNIGKSPFCITLGMLMVFGNLLGGAALSFHGWDFLDFPVAPVVIFVPMMAAFLLLYISDGVLSLQRVIIGAIVTMGVFFYLGDISRLQMRWLSYSIAGNLPLDAFDILLENTRRTMLAVTCGQLLSLFVLPVVFSRLRTTQKNLFVCCIGAMTIALASESLVYGLIAGGNWMEKWRMIAPLLSVKLLAGWYLAGLLSLYITKMGEENDSRQIKPLEILFAFFGSYEKSKRLEADLLKWEGRYKAILENASEMIVIIDDSGKILDANKAAAIMLKKSVLSGRKFEDFLNEENAEKFHNVISMSSGTSEPTGQIYLDVISGKQSENTLYLALTVTPLIIGALKAQVIMGRDITGERRLSEEKQRLNEELAHSQRLESLGQLAGGVAHDFNNNIHAILGHADLIAMRKGLDEKSRGHLNKIIEIAENSGGLTSQLLGFARKGKYRESDFDLRILVRRTAELFMPGCKNIEFSVETADEPQLVTGDQIQLQQVLLNMLLNARDAVNDMTDRDLCIDLRLFPVEPDKMPACIVLPENLTKVSSAAMLTIRDNGCGMSPETVQHMFEPFFTTKPVGQGTGMGMAMAYGTIQSHHGAIGVESTPGVGTVIYIVLPKIRERMS